MDTKERNRTGRRSSGTTATRTRRPRRTKDSEVVYTQPKAFQRKRFFLYLLTVVAVVLALTLGMSLFFSVKLPIYVSGTNKYTPNDIAEASGIQEGESLLTLNKAKIAGKIKAQLPYVDQVRIGIRLPDMVNIEITEFDVVYAVQAEDGQWWLMTAGGRIVEQTNAVQADSYAKVLGVQIAQPQVGQQAVAAQPEAPTEATEETTEEQTQEEEAATEAPTEPAVIPVTVFASEQLDMAIKILQALEDNSVLGGVDSVDVTEIYNLQIWYEDRYQVMLGDGNGLNKKILAMKQAIAQMTDYQRGELDVSFITWPDQVGYTPFLDE